MQLVHDYSPTEFRNNVIALAKLGKVFNLPTVLTTSLGQGVFHDHYQSYGLLMDSFESKTGKAVQTAS